MLVAGREDFGALEQAAGFAEISAFVLWSRALEECLPFFLCCPSPGHVQKHTRESTSISFLLAMCSHLVQPFTFNIPGLAVLHRAGNTACNGRLGCMSSPVEALDYRACSCLPQPIAVMMLQRFSSPVSTRTNAKGGYCTSRFAATAACGRSQPQAYT